MADWRRMAPAGVCACPTAFPTLPAAAVEHLRKWALADVGPGRLIPWLPIAFGTGIVIYFSADREPAWWALAAGWPLCVLAAMQLAPAPGRVSGCRSP